MKSIFDLIESLLGKALAKLVVALAIVAWASFLFTTKMVEIRDDLREQFRQVRTMVTTNTASINVRIAQIDDTMWTTKMQAEYVRIASEWNPTNKWPDPYRIWRDIRDGKQPIGVRIGP